MRALVGYPLFWIVLSALLIRAAAAPYYLHPENALYDPATYRQGDLWENMSQAREIIDGGGLPQGTFIHGPLYVYFVAAMLAVGGGQIAWIYLIQMLFGAATAVLVFLTARRIFNRLAAMAAGFLAALYAPLIYCETLLSCDALNSFGVAGILYLAVRWIDDSTRRWWVVPVWLGVALGGVTLMRGNLCLLGLGIAGGWLVAGWEPTLRRRLQAIGIVAAVATLMILPACLWNTLQSGKPSFVTGEAGTIWAFAWSSDSPGYFHYPTGPLLSPWSPQAWALAGRKLGQCFVWFEFPDLTNIHLYGKLAPVVGFNPLSFRVLSPLALLGMVLAWPERRRLAILYATLISLVVAMVLFYISGRYRLALLPMMWLFAGYSLARWIEVFSVLDRPQRWLQIRWMGPLTFGLAMAVNLYNPSGLMSIWHGDMMFSNHTLKLAVEHLNRGDLAEARRLGKRLFWVASPETRVQALLLEAVFLRKEGQFKAARELKQDALEIQKTRDQQIQPDQPDSSYRPFPPSS